MRKFIALILCFMLCFNLLPLAVQGAGPVQYAAVTGTTIVTADINSIADAAAVEGCNTVVVYSLDGTAALSENISLNEKKLVISNVELTGDVQLSGNMYTENLLLLGDAIVTTTGAGYVFSGTSGNGTAKGALTSESFNDIPAVTGAIADARVKYTVTGTVEINSSLEVYDMVINDGASFAILAPAEGSNRLSVKHSLAVNGAGTLTADQSQRLELWDNASVTGLTFYEQDGATELQIPLEYSHLEFEWNGSKWIFLGGGGPGDPGPGDEDPPGDGTLHTVTVTAPVNGSISAAGMTDYTVEVLDWQDHTFTITPADGYKVFSVLVTWGDFIDDQSWNLSYNGDGSFDFLLEDVQDDLALEVVFQLADVEELLCQTYVVLLEEADEIESVLAGQFGSSGYVVTTAAINVSEVSIESIDVSGYGTFAFTVTLGEETSAAQTGYIVSAFDDVIFKLTDEEDHTEIIVARDTSAPGAAYEVEVPAMHSGTMEVLGYGNLVPAPFDPALGESIVDGKVPLPFYRAQFHIFSFSSGLNLYGFYVIQADAFCVQVAAESGAGEQKTQTWDLGRYADLTEGSYTSKVFFGNDEFVLSLPSSDIGGLETLTVETGSFNGYTVGDNGDETYSVEFLSDYYDFVTINLTINGSIQRQLNIHRVGVHIDSYIWEEGPPSFNVFHGTQYGTLIDFSDSNLFRVYGTYYIPDYGESAPYGLYVIYTWQNGSKTTQIITEPCNNPNPASEDHFSDGVFRYGENQVNACDYLLYSGTNAQSMPAKINVTVLKDDPTASGTFGGIFFGSGAGVEWNWD